MANTTHTAPSGFHFTLRPPSAVPERLRRPVVGKLMDVARSIVGADPGAVAATITSEDMGLAEALNDLLALALLVEWSTPAPISIDSLLDLPMGDYDAVRKAVAPQAVAMMPDFSPTPEPGTPTTP